jgi:diguanylate cyclase (GGDEF)-like protein
VTGRAVDMRGTSLRAGLQGSALLSLAVGGWALATLDRPNRAIILALVSAIALTAVVLAAIPAERITRHPHAPWLFAGWSVMAVAGVSGAVAADGGGELSPLTLTYVVPLIFSALAYPMRMIVGIAVLDAAACAITLTLATGAEAADVAYVTVLLLIAAFLCATHAHAHARHAREAERLSRTDVLTGCLNRRGFDEELERRVARRQRYGAPFGLVLFDLDAFKDVNDRLGHAAGDELLRRVAATATDAVRTSDAVCRIGGDEFGVLLDGASSDCAAHTAARLRSALGEHASVSVGWAACPEDAEDGDELYRRADAWLYRHKPQSAAQPASPHPAAAPGVAPAA